MVVWVRIVITLELACLVAFCLLSIFGSGWAKINSSGSWRPPSTFDLVGTMWCKYDEGIDDRRNQRILLLWRLAVFLWMLMVMIKYCVENLLEHQFYQEVVCFYTCWNYAWQICYWGCATLASLRSQRYRRAVECLSTRFRIMLHVLFEVSVPVSILVSTVFWGILAPKGIADGEPEKIFNFTSYNMHAINTGFMLVEFLVGRLCVEKHHVVFALLWSLVFVIFTWIQHVFTDFYPYFFLELDPPAIFWYNMLIFLHAVVFFVTVWASNYKKQRLQARSTVLLNTEGSNVELK